MGWINEIKKMLNNLSCDTATLSPLNEYRANDQKEFKKFCMREHLKIMC